MWLSTLCFIERGGGWGRGRGLKKGRPVRTYLLYLSSFLGVGPLCLLLSVYTPLPPPHTYGPDPPCTPRPTCTPKPPLHS